jgi:hypothetical protein
VNDDGGPANDDAIIVIAIVVVSATLMHVRPAAILFGLPRRQAAVTPTYATATHPAGRTAVTIVTVVFVAAAALPTVVIAVAATVVVAVATPAVIVAAEMFAVLSLVFIPSMIRHGTGSGHS